MNANKFKYFLKMPLRPLREGPAMYIDKPSRLTKGGLNFHKSNRAREGLLIILKCHIIK